MGKPALWSHGGGWHQQEATQHLPFYVDAHERYRQTADPGRVDQNKRRYKMTTSQHTHREGQILCALGRRGSCCSCAPEKQIWQSVHLEKPPVERTSEPLSRVNLPFGATPRLRPTAPRNVQGSVTRNKQHMTDGRRYTYSSAF